MKKPPSKWKIDEREWSNSCKNRGDIFCRNCTLDRTYGNLEKKKVSTGVQKRNVEKSVENVENPCKQRVFE